LARIRSVPSGVVSPLNDPRIGLAKVSTATDSTESAMAFDASCTNIYTNNTATGDAYLPGAGCQLIDFGCSNGGVVCEFDFGYFTDFDPGVVNISFYQSTSSTVCPGTFLMGYNVGGLQGGGAFFVTVTINPAQPFTLPPGNFGYGYPFDNGAPYAAIAPGGACPVTKFWDCSCSPIFLAGLYMRVAAAACTTPAITANPSSTSACTGAFTSFSVTASGTTPAYQWRRGATNLVNGGNISGATSAVLSISPVSAGDAAANYNCVVTNSCGSAASNNATLTVNAAATFSAQPSSRSACAGSL